MEQKPNQKDVLIIVDLQNDFVMPNGKLFLGHDTSDLRKRIGDFANNFPGTVIATQDTHSDGCCEFATFPPHCIEDTDGWEVVKEITKIDAKFGKQSYKSQLLTDFILKRIDAETTIYVTGVCTHICCHDIITDIVNESKNLSNFIPKIVIFKDMVDDFNTEMAEFALKRLQNLYGVTVR